MIVRPSIVTVCLFVAERQVQARRNDGRPILRERKQTPGLRLGVVLRLD